MGNASNLSNIVTVPGGCDSGSSVEPSVTASRVSVVTYFSTSDICDINLGAGQYMQSGG